LALKERALHAGRGAGGTAAVGVVVEANAVSLTAEACSVAVEVILCRAAAADVGSYARVAAGITGETGTEDSYPAVRVIKIVLR
jgi:hypothetical protein